MAGTVALVKHCGRAACRNDLSDMRSDAVWCSPACRVRVSRGEKAYKPRTKRPGGAQLPYLRVRALLEGEIALRVLGSPVASADATRWAESQLLPLLSDRQRAQVEADV